MSYLLLARKYRPETFAEVVGQGHVTGTLRAAIRKGKLSHAYVFAANRHQGQIRQSGEPYFTHPLTVAWILAEMELDEETVAAGLLQVQATWTREVFEQGGLVPALPGVGRAGGEKH